MSGLMDFFGDNSSEYNDYSDQLNQLAANFQPWEDAGKKSLSDIMAQYQKLQKNPTFLQDSIAKNYQMSPYATVQTSWLKNELNNNAAETGTLGSSYAADTMGSNLQDLVSKDENNYINTGINSYNRGLSGEEGLNQEGFAATQAANTLKAQGAQARMQGQMSSQDALNNMVGGALSVGSNFVTGGNGGFSTLVGGLGKQLLPTSWTNRFQDPNVLNALSVLKRAGLFGGSNQQSDPNYSNGPLGGAPYAPNYYNNNQGGNS